MDLPWWEQPYAQRVADGMRNGYGIRVRMDPVVGWSTSLMREFGPFTAPLSIALLLGIVFLWRELRKKDAQIVDMFGRSQETNSEVKDALHAVSTTLALVLSAVDRPRRSRP